MLKKFHFQNINYYNCTNIMFENVPLLGETSKTKYIFLPI